MKLEMRMLSSLDPKSNELDLKKSRSRRDTLVYTLWAYRLRYPFSQIIL